MSLMTNEIKSRLKKKSNKELNEICDIIEKEFFSKYSSYTGNKAPDKYIKGAFNEKAFKKALDQFRNGAPEVKAGKKLHTKNGAGLLNLSLFYASLIAQIPTRLSMLAEEIWKKLDSNYSKNKKIEETDIKEICDEFEKHPNDEKFKSALYPLNELQVYCNLPKSSELNKDIIREISVCIKKFKKLASYMNKKEGSVGLNKKITEYLKATKKSEKYKERVRKAIAKNKTKIDKVWEDINSLKAETAHTETTDSNIKKSLEIVVKKLEKVIDKIADIRTLSINSKKVWENIIDELVKSLRKAVRELESILKKKITVEESNDVEAIKLQLESYIKELEKLKKL